MDITFPRSRLAKLADFAITAINARAINRAETPRRAAADSPAPETARRDDGRTRAMPTGITDSRLMQARVGPLGPYFGVLRR